jgi:BolA family transcriptional regulator, general stress-responsive regulator
MSRLSEIETKLRASLQPVQLDIEDESHKHAGHAGASSGGGHFNVTIVSTAFAGKSLLQRHRLIYDALGDTLRREIHALSIRALTPDET